MPASPEPSPAPPLGAALVGAAIGGALFGVADALGVMAESASTPGPALRAVVVAACGGLFAVAAVGAALPVLLAVGRRLAPIVGDPPQWLGFWVGLGLSAPLEVALRAAGGTPLGVQEAALAVGAPLVALALALAPPPGRPRVFAVMAGLAPLVGMVEYGRRDVGTDGFPDEGVSDVLLVTVEGLRGAPWPEPAPRLPVLDGLAAEGVSFARAVAPQPDGTTGAVAAVTGALPWAPAVGVPAAVGFRADGWRTAAFVGRAAVGDGIDAGFEVVDARPGVVGALSGTVAGRLLAFAGVRPPARRSDRATVDAALAWLAVAREDRYRPAFVWVHLAGPAVPVSPAPPWDTAYAGGDPRDPGRPPLAEALDLSPALAAWTEGRTDPGWVVGQHAGAASAADEQIGRLVEALAAHPRGAQATVVVVGTHGVALGDGGVWLRPEPVPTVATASVPLLVRAPGRLPAGVTSNEVVSPADLPATLLELGGVGVEDAPVGSLVPVAFGRRGRTLAATRGGAGGAVRVVGRWFEATWAAGVLSEGAPEAAGAFAAAVSAGELPPEPPPGLRAHGAPPPE